jgi:hypothetical protein
VRRREAGGRAKSESGGRAAVADALGEAARLVCGPALSSGLHRVVVDHVSAARVRQQAAAGRARIPRGTAVAMSMKVLLREPGAALEVAERSLYDRFEPKAARQNHTPAAGVARDPWRHPFPNRAAWTAGKELLELYIPRARQLTSSSFQVSLSGRASLSALRNQIQPLSMRGGDRRYPVQEGPCHRPEFQASAGSFMSMPNRVPFLVSQ